MNLKLIFIPVLALMIFLNSSPSDASARDSSSGDGDVPLALVWNGPGTCKPACGKAAARVANQAGFDVQFIYPGFTDFSLFKEAKLWVQPGGVSSTAAESMGPELIAQVRQFVSDGGGYVGFCAGAFFSTSKIGQLDVDGFGVIPGQTELYIQSGSDHQMLNISTPDGDRLIYYAGGPYFKVTDQELQAVQGEVTARYDDGKIAGLHAHYGKGKVAVIGLHPEAGWAWKLAQGQVDHDGNDFDIAIDMINYATTP